jgi:hypothetical protein
VSCVNILATDQLCHAAFVLAEGYGALPDR